MIWQSPGLPGWRKVNFITVTRRHHHPNIAAGFCCLATSPGFLPTLCEKWSGFFYVHRVFLSYTRDWRLKVSSERLGNEDKAPCPRALLPGRGSNRGPPVWKSEALTTRPRQLPNLKLMKKIHYLSIENVDRFLLACQWKNYTIHFGKQGPPPLPFSTCAWKWGTFCFRIPLPKIALNGPIFIKWTHLWCISVTIRGEKKP